MKKISQGIEAIPEKKRLLFKVLLPNIVKTSWDILFYNRKIDRITSKSGMNRYPDFYSNISQIFLQTLAINMSSVALYDIDSAARVSINVESCVEVSPLCNMPLSLH